MSDNMIRHLCELVDLGEHWTPIHAGEWAAARALERRGFVEHNPSRGRQPYSLTDKGRAWVEVHRREASQ